MVSKMYAFYFTIFGVFVASEATFQVYFNEHADGAGASASVEAVDGTCYNFSAAWNDRVSQLTTPYFACLDVYENSGCCGKVQHYAAGYAMFVELGGNEFNDFISSFRVSSPGTNGCDLFLADGHYVYCTLVPCLDTNQNLDDVHVATFGSITLRLRFVSYDVIDENMTTCGRIGSWA